MAFMQRWAALLAAAGIVAGCSGSVRTYPVPPPPQVEPRAKVRYNYDHKLDPEPGYEAKDIDALARQLYGIAPKRRAPRTSPRPLVIIKERPNSPSVEHARRTRRPGLRAGHYLNTLFWGGLGAVIGHQSGHASEGAIIGAAYGHALDHGGVHGLLSPGTIIGGAAGALGGSFSGDAGKGALYGAAAGHLLDDVFRAREE